MSSKKIPEKIPENPQWSFLGILPRDDNNDNFERETMFYMQRMNPTAIPEIAKLKNDISTQEAISKNTKKDVLLAELGENLFNYEALEEHFQNRLKLIAGAIPKLEKRIHDISALRGNDRCDTSVKSVAFYTSGHGELINQNIVDDLLVPTLESAANEYFRDNTTRKELFFKYLLTINYSSADSPGIEADMIPTSSMRDTYTCDTSSENNNLVSLFGKYNVAQNNSNELFETTRIQLRKTNPAYLKGTTTLDGSIFFNVDPKNLNTGRNEPKIAEFFEKEGKTYSDHYSEYARRL